MISTFGCLLTIFKVKCLLGLISLLQALKQMKFFFRKQLCNINSGMQWFYLFYLAISSQMMWIYAEVVTFVAGSLEAGGLPGSLDVLVVLK